MAPEKLRADYKSPGGKLIRVMLEEENGIIKEAEITGDFFLLPEDDLPELEEMLRKMPRNASSIKNVVSDFFMKTGVQGLGITMDDLVNALVSAKKIEE